MKPFFVAVSVSAFFFAGCAPQPQLKSTNVSESIIDNSLMQVANEIRSAQQIVANVGRARIDAPDMGMVDSPDLYQTVTVIDWYGELEVILSDLADRVGYSYSRIGQKPAVAYIVHADYNELPINTVLRDLALQAGTSVQINVDPYKRIITLKYLKH